MPCVWLHNASRLNLGVRALAEASHDRYVVAAASPSSDKPAAPRRRAATSPPSVPGASRWLAVLHGGANCRVVSGQAPHGDRLAYSSGNGVRQFCRRRPNYSFKPNLSRYAGQVGLTQALGHTERDHGSFDRARVGCACSPASRGKTRWPSHFAAQLWRLRASGPVRCNAPLSLRQPPYSRVGASSGVR